MVSFKMLMSAVALAATAATASAGVSAPNELTARNASRGGTFQHAPDAENGFYIHIINSEGKPENIFLGEILSVTDKSNATKDTADISRRGGTQGGITCVNQYTLNYYDVNTAKQGLESWYQYGKTFTKKVTSYVYNGAVAYGCNYGNGQTITGTWLGAQFATISQKCGTTGPGYVSYPDWKAQYGVDSSSTSLC